MIQREHYLEQIRPFYDSDLIKIITGIRRCGKSVIMQQVRDEILAKSADVIYLEFEKREVRAMLPNADAVLQYVKERRKSGRCYVFLDEPQEIDGWEEVCQSLRLYGDSVFITGSNSKLLSGELATYLTGRYVEIKITPFSC